MSTKRLNILFTSRYGKNQPVKYRCTIRDHDLGRTFSGWDHNPVRAFQAALEKHPEKDVHWVVSPDAADFDADVDAAWERIEMEQEQLKREAYGKEASAQVTAHRRRT